MNFLRFVLRSGTKCIRARGGTNGDVPLCLKNIDLRSESFNTDEIVFIKKNGKRTGTLELMNKSYCRYNSKISLNCTSKVQWIQSNCQRFRIYVPSNWLTDHSTIRNLCEGREWGKGQM
jgi:hypothetical protein